jgi:hypothetical protein
MVQIKDIRDELEILQMVLTDQRQPIREFSRIIAKEHETIRKVDMEHGESSSARNTVLESHLYRIEKMIRRAEKTYEAVRV